MTSVDPLVVIVHCPTSADVGQPLTMVVLLGPLASPRSSTQKTSLEQTTLAVPAAGARICAQSLRRVRR